eukprot:g918.t1
MVTGEDLPKSFDQSLTQACESVEMMTPVVRGSRSRRSRGIKRLSVEIPALDTGIDQTMILVCKLIHALDVGGRNPATVLFTREDYVLATRKKLPSNPTGLLKEAVNRNLSLSSRLLVFSPHQEDEEVLFELLDEVWRGEVVLLCNAEFSKEFQNKRSSFLSAFNTIYCFLPLAIKVFIINKDGALFRWQKETYEEAKWLIFLFEDGSFKQIGQTANRPTQEQLETTIYNATASESFLSKGMKIFTSFGKSK